MVLSSVSGTDDGAAAQRTQEGASVPSTTAESQPAAASTNEQKPKIDFNVSQEEVDNHRKKME